MWYDPHGAFLLEVKWKSHSIWEKKEWVAHISDFVTFIEEILNGKLHFLCRVRWKMNISNHFMIVLHTGYLLFVALHFYVYTTKNTVISPNFLVWKFCGKAQFPHCFRRIARNYTETVTFHKISKPASYIIQKLCKGIHRQLFKNKILPVQKQIDRYNCGPFAIAFTAEVLDGKSPMEARFDVERMRGHLINCLENKFLMPFPKFLIRTSFATSFDELWFRKQTFRDVPCIEVLRSICEGIYLS